MARTKISLSDAMQSIRADYYTEVKEFGKQIIEEAKEQFENGLEGEQLREWLIEYIDETVDGTQRVIYTSKAQAGVLASDNDGAYLDEFGEEGLVQDGMLDWSKLMYAALRRDIIEWLDREGFDVNDPESYFEEEEDEEG